MQAMSIQTMTTNHGRQEIERIIERGDLPKFEYALETRMRALHKPWRRRLRAVDPEDLSQKAFLSIWSGERDWNPEQCTFYQFVEGVLRSLLWNEANRHEHLKSENFTEDETDSSPADAVDRAINQNNVFVLITPTINQQTALEERQILERIKTLLCTEELIFSQVFKLSVEDGITKPAELSTELRLSIGEVRNLVRRFNRAFARVVNQIQEENE